ncbi:MULTISPECIES: hypothetical protein [unclassified Bacillus (in: firmicutes)]|uniref:hypothetical protein n=1 Tax=unclassified Bacillus (in: firmicutes) TaxID=185979 RepID=UPI001BEBF894|nr:MULTISPECIES: hypothetical protein [unclassified Bacillus (in: firmicutes)]MBT2629588.1 hypothetical protein [Bacillus sp. ISL-101]
MNKFKLYHPLIMAIFYFTLLIFFGYIDLVLRNPNFAIIEIGEYRIHLFLSIIIIGYIVFSTFIIIYTYYYQKLNNGKPFSLKPPEINDEDEGTQVIYHTATKRIYMFYTSVIPILTAIAFLLHMVSVQINIDMVIYVLLTILVIHYLIYYKVILEYVS